LDEQRLVVRLHDPRRLRLLLAAFALLALLAGFGVFKWGQFAAGGAGSRAEGRVAELAATVARLEAETRSLQDELARARTSLEVDREAQAHLQQALAESENRVATLNEELQFYRRIVAPADGRTGLRVQTFEVVDAPIEHSYRLRLLLVQNPRRSGRASGRVEVALHGQLNGAEASLALEQLAAEPQPYEFLYFQDLDLEIIIPEGFVPQAAEVLLRPSGRNARTVTASFPWDAQG
jgi:predicted RNase H-like nuclease (RuvC/YqgF family)